VSGVCRTSFSSSKEGGKSRERSLAGAALALETSLQIATRRTWNPPEVQEHIGELTTLPGLESVDGTSGVPWASFARLDRSCYEQGLHARKYSGMQAFTVATVTQTRPRVLELRKALYTMIPRAASRQAYPIVAFEDYMLSALCPAISSGA